MNLIMRRMALATMVVAVSASVAEAEDLLIHAGRLIDGVTRTPRSQVSIVIHNDRKAHGTYLVPTLLIAHRVLEIARTRPEVLPPTAAAKAMAAFSHPADG